MSFLQPILLALVASATVQAAAPAASPDLVVTGHRWGKVVSKTVITDRGTFTIGPDVRLPPRRPGMPPPTILLQRETYALVKNAGTRTVKAVRWAYVFYADAKRDREVGRHEFRSKETVKPGEMKYLAESVKEEAPTAFDAVIVLGVEYEGDAKR